MPTENQMLNYSPIGMVSILMGIAVVEGPDGLTRLLNVGDEVHADETVQVVGDGDAEITFLDGSRNLVHGGESLHLAAGDFNMDDAAASSGDFRILRTSDVLDPEPQEDLANWMRFFEEMGNEEGMVPAVIDTPPEVPEMPEFGDAMMGLGWLMAGTDECFSITSVDDPDCELHPTEFG